MEFTTDIFSLDKPSSVKFNLVGTRLPNNHDLYFRSKQREIVEQYSAARIFLRETETDDWEHWFNPVEDDVTDKAFKLIFRSHFYETALFYYNAIVDMSWTLCYVSAEFACNQQGKRVDLSGIKPIDEGKRTAMFLEEKVTKYHRTLTTYLNTLLSNSFIINQIVEPQPPENMMDIPGMADEMRRPMMLIVSAKKKM